jgi:4-carboxymuconolactone decarboxylase
MARLPYLTAAEAGPAVAARLRELPQLNVYGLVGHAEGIFEPWLDLAGAVLNAVDFDPVLREVAILRVAALSPGAEYEWDQHSEIARQLGIEEAVIESARSGEGLSGDAELVATFTEQVVLDVAPDDQTLDRALARFGPRGVIELMMIIGQYMLVARVMASCRIDPDPPVGIDIFGALA